MSHAPVYNVIIGPDPNPRDGTRGNGEWRTKSTDVENGLSAIFSTMSFHGEATGRFMLVEGVSLQCPAHDVIQVWTDHPKAHRVNLSKKDIHRVTLRERDDRTSIVGLWMEIHVDELHKWVVPDRKALTFPGMEPGANSVLSPTGTMIHSLIEQRGAIQRSAAHQKLKLALQKRELEKQEKAMMGNLRSIQENVDVISTYLHGGSVESILCTGDKAPTNERYHVFQHRQYVDQEIAVLGNFRDFDFKELDELDRWLVSSGAIWKMLPFPKTILATRLRKKEKDYGSPWVNLLLNQYNMVNYIWIRDGQNVMRIAVDTHFDTTVFPGINQNEEIVKFVEENIWERNFRPYEDRWHQSFWDKSKKPVYGLQKKAHTLPEPYVPRRISREYPSVEDWKRSDVYKKISLDIRDRVFSYMRDKNRKQLKFVLMLQGLIDRGNVLNIPPGTDIFNTENTDKYFRLLSDYTHAISDPKYRDKFNEWSRRTPKKGDLLLMDVGQLYSYADSSAYGRIRGAQIVKVVEVKNDRIVFRYRPNKKRYPYDQMRTPVVAKVDASVDFWFHIDLDPKNAAKLLDDREWKINNRWAVPYLANWRTVMKRFLKRPVIGQCIELPRGEGTDE